MAYSTKVLTKSSKWSKNLPHLLICLTLTAHSYGQNIGFAPDKYLGRAFAPFKLKTINNRKISLGDLQGKPTFINFWFTGCKPCIEEMPELNKIKNQLQDSVNFLAITFDSKEKVKRFLEKHPFGFVHIVNAKEFIDELQMRAFPTNIFLDKNGIVTNVEIGSPAILAKKDKLKLRDGREFETVLRELLKK